MAKLTKRIAMGLDPIGSMTRAGLDKASSTVMKAIKNYKRPQSSLKTRQKIWAESGGGGKYPTK